MTEEKTKEDIVYHDDHVEFQFGDQRYKVSKPTYEIRNEADAVHAKALRKALADGYFMESDIDKILKQRGFDPKETQLARSNLSAEIRSLEVQLVNTDPKNIEEGKKLAFKIQDLRNSLEEIDLPRKELSGQSIHHVADNEKLKYLIFACCSTIDDQPVWDNFETFAKSENDPLGILAGRFLFEIMYKDTIKVYNENVADRTENLWLRDNGLMDDDLNLINNEGKKVSRDGKLINDEGYLIDKDGNRIDIYGNLLDENGRLKSKINKKVKKKKEEEATSV